MSHALKEEKNYKNIIKKIVDEIIKFHTGQSGIIYCLSKKDCNTMKIALLQANISAEIYHASLSMEGKINYYNQWINNEVRIFTHYMKMKTKKI